MHGARIFHLGGSGRFEYVVSSLPNAPDNWHLCIRGARPTAITEVTDAELVEYANCRGEIEAVQRYINKYGPPFLSEVRKGEEFLYAETLPRWRGLQLQFCMTWDRILGIEIRNAVTEAYGKAFPELLNVKELWKAVPVRGEFRLVDGAWVFLAETHYMALVTKLVAVSAAGKLRKCSNPNCPNSPYFIADHGKTQYCCEACGNWGQRQAKLRYWREKKQGRNPESIQAIAENDSNSPNKKELRGKNVTEKAR